MSSMSDVACINDILSCVWSMLVLAGRDAESANELFF
jgi:hypothetical protein